MKLLRQNNGSVEEVEVATGATVKIFHAYLGTEYTSASGFVKISVDTVTQDPGLWWDEANKRVIPDVAGYYLCICRVRVEGAAIGLESAVKFNGGSIPCGSYGTLQGSHGSKPLYCNGTTDYLELAAYLSVSKLLTVGETYFTVLGPF